jgi:hypothetical protein
VGLSLDKGLVSALPPRPVGTPYPVFVLKADTDGNDIGVRLREVAGAARDLHGPGAAAGGLHGCDSLRFDHTPKLPTTLRPKRS